MRIPKGHTPIVNHMAFTDSRPTLGSKSTTYQTDKGPLPKGPPRYINAPGRSTKSVGVGKMSNKRV
jgi:hypothetical protein